MSTLLQTKLLSEGLKSDALLQTSFKKSVAVYHKHHLHHTTEFAALAEFVNWQRKGSITIH